MTDTTEVRFRYAGEVRLDFPELDLAVILKGRLKAEPGLRLPVRARMLKGDVQQLLHGKFQTNVALGHTYGSAIQSTMPYSPKFGVQAVEPLEIKEVRTLSKEGKQPPGDWLFGWVLYPSEASDVYIELSGHGKLKITGALPEELAQLPKYAHVHPNVLKYLDIGHSDDHPTDKLGEVIHFSYIRHAPLGYLEEVANALTAVVRRTGGDTTIIRLQGPRRPAEPKDSPSTKGYKQDAGKLDYNLLMRDLAPQVEQIVKVLHWGHHTKGYPRNGFRTLPDAEGRFMAATQRHLAAMAEDALAKDSESGLHHAIHVIANQLMMLAALEDKSERHRCLPL